jgi:uncharacterized membrane protein (DUF2068 family)
MVSASGSGPRPHVVAVLSITLGCISVIGFGSAVIWNLASARAVASRCGLNAGGWIYTSIDLVYATTALVACIGLWRRGLWAQLAFLAWCAAFAVYNTWFVLHSRVVSDTFSTVVLLVGTVVMLVLLYRLLAATLRWAPCSNNRWRRP